jgi:hypothetical protein
MKDPLYFLVPGNDLKNVPGYLNTQWVLRGGKTGHGGEEAKQKIVCVPTNPLNHVHSHQPSTISHVI